MNFDIRYIFHFSLSVQFLLMSFEIFLMLFYFYLLYRLTYAGCTVIKCNGDILLVLILHTPCGVRFKLWVQLNLLLYLNPRTPYGVRLVCHLICKWLDNLNPRTPCGVRRDNLSFLKPLLVLKSTHSMRSATAILYRNIVFLHRLHLFFWINCFVSKKYYCFFKSFPLSIRCESPSVFSSLPIRTAS